MATAIGDLVARLRMDTGGFRKGARGATGSLGLMGGAAKAAMGPVVALTGALVGAGGLAFSFVKMGKSANDFAGAMNRSVAIMTNVNATIRKDMERTALSVAFNTKFSAREAADAYFFLASAGLDAAQSMAALPKVARFAQAGNFDLSLATDLATDALSALGLKSKDAATNARNLQHVMDNLVKANTLANASVEQFSQALTNKAGAAMRLLGMEIEEGLAVLSVWADQGVKAQDAGTRFDIVMRDLTTKAILNAEAFKAAGIAVFEFGEIRKIADIVEDMERKMGKMTDRGKKATLMQLGFTNRTVTATASLLGASAAIREYEVAQRSAAGTTDKVADNQTDINKAWAQMGASMQKISNDFFPPILDNFASLMSALAGTSEEFDKSSKAMTGWQKAGQWAADMGSAAVIAGRFVGATVGLASQERGLSQEEKTRRFEQKVFGLPELSRPLERSSPQRVKARAERQKQEERESFLQPFKFAAKALFGFTEFAQSLPAVSEDFQGIAREMEGVGEFDFTSAAKELSLLKTRIDEFTALPAASALAERFGRGALEVAGLGPEAAAKMLPFLKEEYDRQQDAFVMAHEKAMEKVKTLGENMWAATRTPMEQYQKGLFDINALLRVGAIDADTAARAQAQAAKTLERATTGPTISTGPRFAGAMERGSAEAFSTIVQAGKGGEKIGKEQLKVQKQLLTVNKQILAKQDPQLVSIPVG